VQDQSNQTWLLASLIKFAVSSPGMGWLAEPLLPLPEAPAVSAKT
jgi:hypothetical protein